MDTNILDTIDMHKIGKELQQARIKCGLTQQEATKFIGVDHATIIAIEKKDGFLIEMLGRIIGVIKEASKCPFI
ncbi:MAG: hypothetical protein NVS4B7_11670 [Ktedonobacteraceae bacterium]